MSKEVAKFEKELQLIFSKQFFFKEPEKTKIWIYSGIYLLLTFLGVILDTWFITGLFSVFFIIYPLAAKGVKFFVPLCLIAIIITSLLGTYYALIWCILHIFIALIIYFSIINRFSKILIISYISAFLFFALALFISIFIKLGYLNFNPQAIQNYINDYIISIQQLQTNVDTEVLRASFEEIKRYFPVLIFSGIFIYVLLLLQYTLSTLSKEKAITPVFPRFSRILINPKYATYYVILSFIVYLAEMAIVDKYDMNLLILENLLALFRWIFVFNGIFTCFYFAELKNKSSIIFSKIIIVTTAYLFSFIFEIIGLIDCLFRIREKYAQYKGGK